MCRDSYHDIRAHQREMLSRCSRGYQRYDPHSRRYKTWYIPEDWQALRVDDNRKPLYPRFTEQDARQILRVLSKGTNAKIDPLEMGNDWNYQGPKVRNHLNILKVNF